MDEIPSHKQIDKQSWALDHFYTMFKNYNCTAYNSNNSNNLNSVYKNIQTMQLSTNVFFFF